MPPPHSIRAVAAESGQAGPAWSVSRHRQPSALRLLIQAVLLMQGVVINDLLTQITAVFVTIRGASNGSGTKTTGNCRILADPRHGPGDADGARSAGATRLGL